MLIGNSQEKEVEIGGGTCSLGKKDISLKKKSKKTRLGKRCQTIN